MARQSNTPEPFPPLHPDDNTLPRQTTDNSNMAVAGAPHRRRRKSSGLGGELPGDSDVAAIATLSSVTHPAPAPLSPRIEKPGRRSKRRSIRRAFSKWKRLSFRHTWLNPLILCLLGVAIYLFNPSPSNPMAAGLFLSYPIPRDDSDPADAPIQYGKGARDFAFVGFYTIFFSFTREFLMQRMIRPIAIKNGIRSRAKQARFMEQYYTAIYFAVFGPFGLYVMSRTPVWYFRTEGFYENFPHKTHDALFKAYYLLQASYWAQQAIVLVLMLEKPRKDFKELVAHHVVTLSLIWSSYRFHFTYMGLAVYITHDISDFFLATSKLLNYLDSPIVGPYYFTFMGIWFYMRHWTNLRILYSILTQFATIGPFELNWETQQYKCRLAQCISFSLLATLQSINIFWWFLIARIAYRFVVNWGEDVKDERSEDEESETEEVVADAATKPTTPAKTGMITANGNGNGYLNGSANGTPKVMLNGVPVPRTPSPGQGFEGVQQPGSIGSRLRERKRAQN
jgi:acyl-CoA-dependent ceramide synthase